MATGSRTAATASHFIWVRSTPRERRKRRIIAIAAIARAAVSAMSASDMRTSDAGLDRSGIGRATATWGGSNDESRRALTAAAARVAPIARAAAARQRGVSGRPSGKSSNSRARAPKAGIQSDWYSRTAHPAPAASPLTAALAQDAQRTSRAGNRPSTARIAPTGLPGRPRAIATPAARAGAAMAIATTTERPVSCGSGSTARRTSAATSAATARAAQVHAPIRGQRTARLSHRRTHRGSVPPRMSGR